MDLLAAATRLLLGAATLVSLVASAWAPGLFAERAAPRFRLPWSVIADLTPTVERWC
ncbi:MAG: hypothetical protein M3R02_26105 [Chloroflexota bacterium]|nr:hypothetical protein [Chloroflexota bacterium]